MEKYIYISINEAANLDLSIIADFKPIIEKYRADIDFIEYHLIDEGEYNLVEYPNDIDIPQ